MILDFNILNILKREKSKAKPKSGIGFVLNERGSYDFFIEGYTPVRDTPEFKTCIHIIADLVSNMTIHLMENTEKGDVRIKNELSRKIDISPCNFMTKKTWLYLIVKNMLLTGNSIIIPQISERGYIEDLLPLNAKKVSFFWDKKAQDYYITYENEVYYSDEFINFVFNPDEEQPYKGTGYTIELKNVNEILNLAGGTRKSFMRGKYLPNIIVRVDSNDETLSSEEGRKKIEEKYLTRTEAGQPWIVPADMIDISQVKPLTLNDLAINESVVLDKKTVASTMRVPAFLLGVGDFKKEEFNNFIQTTIMGFGKIIDQTLTKNLLYSPNLYFKCNPRSLYAYDIKEIAEMGKDLYSSGLLLGNEVRDWIGMTPREELNELIILENYIPASKVGEQKKLKGGDE